MENMFVNFLTLCLKGFLLSIKEYYIFVFELMTRKNSECFRMKGLLEVQPDIFLKDNKLFYSKTLPN